MRQAVAAIARFTVIGCHRLVKWPAEKWPLVARNGHAVAVTACLLSGAKRKTSTRDADFCNKIGTNRTWPDVRVESAFRGRAEVGFRGRQLRVGPRLDIWPDPSL